MILRHSITARLLCLHNPSLLAACCQKFLPQPYPLLRPLHYSLPRPPIPKETTAVPDVAAFLRLVGRNTIQHTSKFTNWAQLFSATSAQLKDAGIEPARDRRYILHWREKFRSTNGTCELYEVKRGRKILGGERRRKELLAKLRAEQNKEKRRQEAAAAAAAASAAA